MTFSISAWVSARDYVSGMYGLRGDSWDDMETVMY
jgi:hypothetical protein